MRDSKSEVPKVPVITGLSRGLGAAAAKRLARDGFFVVVNYVRSKKDGEDVLREIGRGGGKGALVQGVVSSLGGIKSFFEKIDSALEAAGLPASIDVLVANAGILISKPFSEVTEADFDHKWEGGVLPDPECAPAAARQRPHCHLELRAQPLFQSADDRVLGNEGRH